MLKQRPRRRRPENLEFLMLDVENLLYLHEGRGQEIISLSFYWIKISIYDDIHLYVVVIVEYIYRFRCNYTTFLLCFKRTYVHKIK